MPGIQVCEPRVVEFDCQRTACCRGTLACLRMSGSCPGEGILEYWKAPFGEFSVGLAAMPDRKVDDSSGVSSWDELDDLSALTKS